MMKQSVRRAFTLVEVLVSASILGVFLTVVYGVLTIFLSYSRVSAAQADLQGNAEMLVGNVMADIADSAAGSAVTGANGVVFLSPRDSSGKLQRDVSGNLLYQRWICYKLVPSTKILSRSYVAISPVTTVPANPYTPATFPVSAVSSVVARNVASISFSGTAPVTVTATLSTSVRKTDDMRMTISDAINPRN